MRIAAAAAAAVALGLSLPAGAARAEPPEVSGRVFARQTLRETQLDEAELPWSWEQAIASARLAVEYRHNKVVKTVLEVEFSDGDADMKDVYVRWRPVRAWTLKAGRFKKPISAIQLEGLWKLPVVERGLLSDLEFSGVSLPMGGRGDGIGLAWDPKSLPLQAQLALFQPQLLSTVDATEDFAADLYARVDLAVADGVDWGTNFAWVSYQEKPDQQSGFRHAPVVGLDLKIKRGWFRFWADVVIGIDMLPFAIDVATLDLPCELDDTGTSSCPPVELIADRGLFFATRAVASVRLEPSRWLRTVEPFVSASIVDLNTKFIDDEGRQLGAGVTARVTKRFRLQVQGDRTTAAQEAPINDVTRLMLQLGAIF